MAQLTKSWRERLAKLLKALLGKLEQDTESQGERLETDTEAQGKKEDKPTQSWRDNLKGINKAWYHKGLARWSWRVIRIAVSVIVIGSWLFLLIYNLKKPSSKANDFFSATSGQMMQSLTVIAFSFFLVQHKMNMKERLQMCEEILKRLVESYNEYKEIVKKLIENSTPSDEDKLLVGMYKRRINNYIEKIERMPLKEEAMRILNSVKDDWENDIILFSEKMSLEGDKVTITRGEDKPKVLRVMSKDEVISELKRFELLLDDKVDGIGLSIFL